MAINIAIQIRGHISRNEKPGMKTLLSVLLGKLLCSRICFRQLAKLQPSYLFGK